MKNSVNKGDTGITLIALVVTIIVILILAGISIGTIAGKNGIISEANLAKDSARASEIKERIELVALENERAASHGKPQKTKDDLISELESEGKLTADERKKIFNNNYLITIGDININFNEITNVASGGTDNFEEETKVTVASLKGENIVSKNTTVVDENGEKAVIPAGAAITSDSANLIKDGLVIQFSRGDQFVWIPVPTAVSDTEDKATINKAMAVKVGNNYKGLLYDFNGTTSTVKSGCTSTESGNREPEYLLEGIDPDCNNSYTVGMFPELLQEEYNNMIESVKKYGGFYVGRYEMSYSSGGTASSHANSVASTADVSSENMWYGLFTLARNFKVDDGFNSVSSSMIWGSQYDAMLNWMVSNGLGNYVTGTTLPNGGTKNTSSTTTGVNGSTDVINNIYDLYGGRYECTLEANNSEYRVCRGGSYSGSYSLDNRHDIYQNDVHDLNTTRIALYINLT